MTKLKKNIVKKTVKKKVGRTNIKSFILEKREKIFELAQAGYTDREISKYIGVGYSTFNRILANDKEFKESLKKAKLKADITVENSLYKRATGYDIEQEIVEYIPGPGDKPKVKGVKKIKKHIPADVTAQIFWLKNRQPAKWRDKQETNITVTDLSKAKKEIENIFE